MAKPQDTQSVSATDLLEGLHIIDCDSHLTEPPDLWTSRTPSSLKSRVPVQETVDGQTAWYLNGERWASTGGNTIENGKAKVLGSLILQPFERIDPAAWSVKERLELLDDMDVFAQVLYPNAIGFSSNHIFAIENADDRIEVLRVYNDFLADTQHESEGRLFPQAMLPIWDMDLTVKEMGRLVDKGIRGFTLSDRPELLGLPELTESYYQPMWDLFNDSGAVANFHIGSGRRRDEMEALRAQGTGNAKAARGIPAVADPAWSYFGKQRRLAVTASQASMSNVRIIVNLCMSNLFDRFPKLKIVSAESGIGWIPFILETLEYQFDEMVTEKIEVEFASRRPTEYFRDHLFVMFWFEKTAPLKLIEDIGVENVLVETDVPHPTCLYPGAREHFAKVLADVDDYARRRVLQDNAAELYRIALPSRS
jgi:predicted TIM-barrel fold metal-dependent hydrolase